MVCGVCCLVMVSSSVMMFVAVLQMSCNGLSRCAMMCVTVCLMCVMLVGCVISDGVQ